MNHPEGAPGIPSPMVLARYEAVMSGLPRLLWNEHEASQAHAREMERHDAANRTRGQWMGFVLAMAFLAVSGWLIHDGEDAAGVILGSVDLVTLVTVFVVGRGRLQWTARETTPAHTAAVLRDEGPS